MTRGPRDCGARGCRTASTARFAVVCAGRGAVPLLDQAAALHQVGRALGHLAQALAGNLASTLMLR